MKARMMKIRRRLSLQRFARDERGIQLVELAIAIPVLLIIFGAATEFARYFYEYTTLAKSTRVAARYLATAGVNAAEDARAKNLVVYGNQDGTGAPVLNGLTTGNVTITRAGGVAILPQTVTVQITGFQHQSVFNLGALINNQSLSLDIDLKPSTTMRYLLTQPLV